MRKNNSQKIKRTTGEKILFTVVYVLLMLLSVYILYYFYFALQLATKKDPIEFSEHAWDNKLATWSKNITFKHFKDAFIEMDVYGTKFFGLVKNSCIYAIGSNVLVLFFHACTTYVICKYKFVGKKALYDMVLITMMIPIYGALPAAYKAYNDIGIYNNWGILITACEGFSGTMFLIFYAYWKGVSWEYAESAFIDGAGHFRTFFQIMLPLVLPVASVLFLTGFIGHWNEVQSVALFMPDLPTLSYGLFLYDAISQYEAQQPTFFAGVLIATVPCFLLFVLFQNTIMQTVNIGGLKG